MSKLTDRIAVWDKDPDSFDGFAAQCRWFQRWLQKAITGTGDSTCGSCFRDGTTGIYENGLGLEYLLWRIREEMCRPAGKQYVDEYLFDSRETIKNR